MKQQFLFLVFASLLLFGYTSFGHAGIPIKLDATTVTTIQAALPGMSLDESARLLRARLQEWHTKTPKPDLHVEMIGDSALLMAGDQTIWGFGGEEQHITGISPAVSAFKLELALRELVYNKSVVQETRDPLSRLLIALILIPMALVILWASWVRIIRYLRVAFIKSRKSAQRLSQSHYYIQTVDLSFTIVTRIGLFLIVLAALFAWFYLFSSTRTILQFAMPFFGNAFSIAGNILKWLIGLVLVWGGILLLLRLLKARLAEEMTPDQLERRFSRFQRVGIVVAVVLSLPLGIGLPAPIAWAFPIAVFLAVSVASTPLLKSLFVGIFWPLDPTHSDVRIRWQGKLWLLDDLKWVFAHVRSDDGDEAVIPLHWFLDSHAGATLVRRVPRQENGNSES